MATVEERPTSDAVVQEVRRIKETLAQAQSCDVRRILKEARENQTRSGRTVLPVPEKRPT